MEHLLKAFPVILFIVLWIIVIHAIATYDPKKEEMYLMKDERGEDVVIFKVDMMFDKYHNHIQKLSFRCGHPDEDTAVKGCLDECANIAFKLGIVATMKIVLTDEDTGEKKEFWKIRRNSETSELVDADAERILNCNV